jgi:hypothetical protein
MSLEFDQLRLYSRAERAHKVDTARLGGTPDRGVSFGVWLASLPGFLGAEALRAAVDAIVAARQAGRPVVFAFGGHVVKTGCTPLVVDLMERGIVTALATNGSGAIHDLELAETGATSEEVADTIRDGSFGMVHETCERMNAAATRGADGRGLGRALGELLEESAAPFRQHSLFATAARLGLPATVHVALGTDTVHMHPQADGAAIGAATLADFRTFCGVVAQMTAAADSDSVDPPGGVYLNVGSAVVMPEVFLKAVSVARNLGHTLAGMHTVNLDMLRHYRPQQNVLTRPVERGHGHSLIGQHEIMLPLLRQALVERLDRVGGGRHVDG